MLGGTAVRVSGPCLEETDLINCTFGGISTPGLYISNMEALCVSPQLAVPGAVTFQLTVEREGQVEFQGEETFYACKYICVYVYVSHHFYVSNRIIRSTSYIIVLLPVVELSEVHIYAFFSATVSTDRGHSVDYVPHESFGLRLSPGHQFTITWDKDSLLPIINSSDLRVDVSLYELQSDTGKWNHFSDVVSNMGNSGEMNSSIPSTFCRSGILAICPVVVLVQVSLTFTQMESEVLSRIKESDMKIGAWSGVRYFTQLSSNSGFGNLCDDWEKKQDGVGDRLRDRLRPCPLNLRQASTPNSGFEEQKISSLLGNTLYATQWIDYFHPRAQACYVQSSTIRYDMSVT